MSKIDVILPTYNQANFLERAVDAILNQEFKDFTLIIVNDGSVDDTKSKLREYEGKDPRIVIINNATNLGLPASLNIGHRYGQASYCTWVSTDNISYKKHLLSLYEHIQKDNYDFVQSFWVVKKDDRTLYKDIRGCKDNWGYGNLCPSFLYKRQVWETYNYDENMLCAEDLKFYLQAMLHPFNFGHVEEYLVEYYVQPNSLTYKGNPNRKHSDMLDEIYRTVILPKSNNGR